MSGSVQDEGCLSLVWVNIAEKVATTDFDGNYTFRYRTESPWYYIGYTTVKEAVNKSIAINITLTEAVEPGEVQLVGSGSPKRTSTDTALPVDVMDITEVSTQSGRIEVTELLQYAPPSINTHTPARIIAIFP